MSSGIPRGYPRRVLLAVTGFSPQVVTETLYSLVIQRQPAFIPTEIHLITTSEGRQHAALTLLHPHQGKFRQFIADFCPDQEIAFSEEHIHVLTSAEGDPLADIRDGAQNTAAANTITALVRQFTADPECALHVSIAGGRKTMGFYLGYALTLFGRAQDRLSHVLVSPPIEGNHQFYYPPPTPEVLFTRDNQPINTADAEIILAEIPFVSLRHGMPAELLAGEASFSEAVAALQRSFAPPLLKIDMTGRQLVCGETPVSMPPQLFTFYAWLVQRRAAGTLHGGHVRYTDDVVADFLRCYRQVVGSMAHDYEAAVELFKDGMPKEFFEEKKARINAALKKQLGAGATPYQIVASGKRPTQRFGLGLGAEAIEIIEDHRNTREVGSL